MLIPRCPHHQQQPASALASPYHGGTSWHSGFFFTMFLLLSSTSSPNHHHHQNHVRCQQGSNSITIPGISCCTSAEWKKHVVTLYQHKSSNNIKSKDM